MSLYFTLPSQSQQNSSTLFVNKDNTPLKIFVEASIRNRPKIVRSLKSNGAEICIDPAQASIIIVDPTTEEARTFVTNWGSEHDTVVLDYAWVRKCIDSGRPLLASDAWGGCNNLEGMREEDFYKDDVEDGFDELGPEPGSSKSSKRKQLCAPAENDLSAASTHPRADNQLVYRTPNDPMANVANSHLNPPSSSNVVSPPVLDTGNLQNGVYNNATGQSTTLVQIPNSQFGQLQQFPQFSVQTPILSPIPQQLIAPSLGTNDIGAMLLSQCARENPAQFMQFFQVAMQNMTQGAGSPPNMPSLGQLNINQLWNTPARPGHDAQAWPQPGSSMSAIQNSNGSFLAKPLLNSHSRPMTPIAADSTPRARFNTSGPPASEYRRNSSISPTRQMFDSPPIATLETSSVSRKRRRSTRKELSETLPASLSRKRTVSPSSFSGLSSAASEKRVNQGGDLSSGLSSYPSTTSQPELLSTIFTDEDGSPLLFFVQVDIRNRMQIIQTVKKNGGKITAEMSDANFIILSAKGPSFNKLGKEVIALRRYALLSNFVHACVEAGELLDEEDFVIEEISVPMRSRRKLSPSKAKASSPQKVLPATVLHPREGSRIPVPVPPSKTTIQRNGSTRYTPEEKEYMLQVVRWAYHQDINLPQVAIARHLHANVPSHTDTSWRTYMQQCKDEIRKIREDAIAEREQEGKTNDNEGECEGSPCEDEFESEEGSEGEPTVETTAIVGDPSTQTQDQASAFSNVIPIVPHHSRQGEAMLKKFEELITSASKRVEDPENDISKDLVVVSCYMAIQQLPEKDEDESAFWDAATQFQQCRTAPSWQTFYALNKDKVLVLLKDIIENEDLTQS